jgi:hypothetical protein
MPFAALAGGAAVVVFVLKRVRAAQPAAGPSRTDAAPYEKEIEEELRKLTPED